MDPEWLSEQIAKAVAALESIAESLDILSEGDEEGE